MRYAVNNPVMHAELRHQRHVIQSSRSGWFWVVLAMLMLLPALLTTLVVIFAALFSIDLQPLFAQPPLSILGQVGLTTLIIMYFALYIVVTLVTLALAAASVSREQTAHTWESLLLTNMSARQIVQGKCWATLRALWGDHLLVLVLRLGFVTYLDLLGSDPDFPNPFHLLTGLAVVTIITLADSALTVILGILPPVSGGNPVVMTLAFALRFAVSVAVLVVTFGIGLLVHEWNPLLVGVVIVGMSLYALVAWGMLRFAEWAAVRNLVSPVPKAS
jgi:hypothetical protein